MNCSLVFLLAFNATLLEPLIYGREMRTLIKKMSHKTFVKILNMSLESQERLVERTTCFNRLSYANFSVGDPIGLIKHTTHSKIILRDIFSSHPEIISQNQ